MKKRIAKDKKKRALVQKYEKKRLFYKMIILNTDIPKNKRFNAMLALAKLPRSSSATRITNYCVISGRSKSVYRDFKMSRIMLRDLGGQGLIPGLKKSSW